MSLFPAYYYPMLPSFIISLIIALTNQEKPLTNIVVVIICTAIWPVTWFMFLLGLCTGLYKGLKRHWYQI